MRSAYDYIIVKNGTKTKAKNYEEAKNKTGKLDAYMIICKKDTVKQKSSGAEVEEKNIIRYSKGRKNKPKSKTGKELLKMTLREIKYQNQMLDDNRHYWYD